MLLKWLQDIPKMAVTLQPVVKLHRPPAIKSRYAEMALRQIPY
jgi:hypothetical protein